MLFDSGRRGWRGGEWIIGLGLGFTNPVRTGGVLDVCLCLGYGGVGGWCRRGVCMGVRRASGGVGGVMSV